MTRGGTIFTGISARLERRQHAVVVDAVAGILQLHDDDRSVRVALDPDMLVALAGQLDEHDISELAHSPQASHDELRARLITMWIEEIFESDIYLSLVDIRLSRSPDSQIHLIDVRGPARRTLPLDGMEGGHWKADRPAD